MNITVRGPTVIELLDSGGCQRVTMQPKGRNQAGLQVEIIRPREVVTVELDYDPSKFEEKESSFSILAYPTFLGPHVRMALPGEDYDIMEAWPTKSTYKAVAWFLGLTRPDAEVVLFSSLGGKDTPPLVYVVNCTHEIVILDDLRRDAAFTLVDYELIKYCSFPSKQMLTAYVQPPPSRLGVIRERRRNLVDYYTQLSNWLSGTLLVIPFMKLWDWRGSTGDPLQPILGLEAYSKYAGFTTRKPMSQSKGFHDCSFLYAGSTLNVSNMPQIVRSFEHHDIDTIQYYQSHDLELASFTGQGSTDTICMHTRSMELHPREPIDTQGRALLSRGKRPRYILSDDEEESSNESSSLPTGFNYSGYVAK